MSIKNENKKLNDSNLKEKIKNIQIKLTDSIEESKKNWDLFIRSQADIENIKKRTSKDISNIEKYSQKNIFLDLFPLIDSFDSCLSSKNYKHEKNFEGINLFSKILTSILKKYNVEKINTKKYTNLDPFKHEVILIIQNTQHNNKIASTFQSGYKLHDKIIRYAKVSIFKKNNM